MKNIFSILNSDGDISTERSIFAKAVSDLPYVVKWDTTTTKTNQGFMISLFVDSARFSENQVLEIRNMFHNAFMNR